MKFRISQSGLNKLIKLRTIEHSVCHIRVLNVTLFFIFNECHVVKKREKFDSKQFYLVCSQPTAEENLSFCFYGNKFLNDC